MTKHKVSRALLFGIFFAVSVGVWVACSKPSSPTGPSDPAGPPAPSTISLELQYPRPKEYWNVILNNPITSFKVIKDPSTNTLTERFYGIWDAEGHTYTAIVTVPPNRDNIVYVADGNRPEIVVGSPIIRTDTGAELPIYPGSKCKETDPKYFCANLHVDMALQVR